MGYLILPPGWDTGMAVLIVVYFYSRLGSEMLDVTSKVPSVTTDNNILILNQSQQQNTLATWHQAHAARIQT